MSGATERMWRHAERITAEYLPAGGAGESAMLVEAAALLVRATIVHLMTNGRCDEHSALQATRAFLSDSRDEQNDALTQLAASPVAAIAAAARRAQALGNGWVSGSDQGNLVVSTALVNLARGHGSTAPGGPASTTG